MERAETIRRRIGWTVTAAVLLTPLVSAAPAGASAKAAEQLIVVRLKSPTVRAASVLKGLAASRPDLSPPTRYIVKVPAGQVQAELDRLHAQPGVLSVSVAQAVHAAQVNPTNQCYAVGCNATYHSPNGPIPGFWHQDYLKVIGAPDAWAISKGQGIRVAVLDSGFYYDHPDLRNKIHALYNI